ncbi:MAG: aminopeptidase P family protein [Brumimicrobium sp.]
MVIKEKLSALRSEMDKNNIDAFIIYSSDPHASEYLPEEWKERTWISGFTGSAGWVVVLKDKAGLWTDGRYFTQANIQLKNSGIDLFKDGIEGTPNYIDWIASETKDYATVGVNALATTHANWINVKNTLKAKNKKLVHLPLLENIWVNRKAPSQNPVFVHPIEKAGETVESKITNIRKKIKEKGCSAHIINTLDDIAWILNLRGSDVECNPVFLSYLFITEEKSILFVDKDKLTSEAITAMQNSNVSLRSYSDLFTFLKEIKNEVIWVSPNVNQSIIMALEQNNNFHVAPTPSSLMKAVKNKTELAGFRSAMVKDGVAMVNFLYWLTHNVGNEPLTEFSIGEKLEGFRREQKDFVGISFDSIVGYKGNGAIIHYRAPENGSAEVTNDGSILIDSGGQYKEGTTDITRTLPLGKVSDEFRRDYTLVMKGHIQLGMSKFPKGTRGVQLDTLARLALWKEGKDYNHGTGHGVGSFLNVHEGPQNIRKDMNPQELLEGMVISNEPGYYIEDRYGIRHENLIVVTEWKKTEWNTFYEFETITYCPFFSTPLIKDLLSDDEIQWYNDYHKMVKEKLEPYLEGDVKKWFLEMVKPI